jgi:hypothetical protein
LLYVTPVAEPATFAGTVKNAEGEAVENATVTLVSTDGDNVQYAGTTDATGAYSINVVQANRNYNVTVSAPGYIDAVAVVEFNGEDQSENFVIDIPLLDKYFVNTDLASTEGWTAVASDGYRDFGNGKIGEYTVRFKPATVDENHLATEYAFGFEARWKPNFASYTQESKTELPAGVYTLTYDVENVNAATSSVAYENRFTVTVGDQVFTDQNTEWMKGGTNWQGHSIVFVVPEDAKATLSFGYGLGNNNISADVTPALYVSHLDMTFQSLLDYAVNELNAEIAKAEALKTDFRTQGVDEMNAAIAAAQAQTAATELSDVNAAIEALKQAENDFVVLNAPLAEGVYYIYNAYSKKFLSRGKDWGTRAVGDDYGLPFNLKVNNDNTYAMQMLDNNCYYGDDYWMYADCTGDRVRNYSFEKTEGGFYIHNTARNVADNRVYIYLKDDADKWAIAGNAIVGDNVGDEAQTVWQFVSVEQHNAMIAARDAAAKAAAFQAAGIQEDAQIENAGEAHVLTFETGSAWTFNSVRGSATTNGNGTEVFQGTGSFTQNVENLENGLYKVSIQAFYRDGANAAVANYTNQGINLSVATLNVNGTEVLVKSWGIDRVDDGNPNSMDQAKALFAQGKYVSETFVYVSDGKLNLTVTTPSFIGGGWFIANNVTYTKVDDVPVAGDANLDGEVTTGDAVAAVNFALEVETPSAKAF